MSHHDHQHGHQHGHSHGHHHHDENTHMNKAHFDEHANEYDEKPFAKDIAVLIAKSIQDTLSHATTPKSEMKVLDFACGTGLIAQHLSSQVKEIVGVDISEGMIRVFNSKSIPNSKGYAGDILTSSVEGIHKGYFDVAFCSQAMHHIEDTHKTLSTLKSYLKPGGVLIIVDFLNDPITHEGLKEVFHRHFDASKHTVAHKGGFSTEEMTKYFEDAGFKNITSVRGFEYQQSPEQKSPITYIVASGQA
eukprot:TRINITY_DN14838_c0_g1_i1.p1 TRINITY_DN14838_c0_g1~~TRINITY_DN14838_c0_g1_i1.p1  ORF type:complete len:277 (-),score=58.74 TRINITY_DN14838_c0_g1_i1:27-767(-)